MFLLLSARPYLSLFFLNQKLLQLLILTFVPLKAGFKYLIGLFQLVHIFLQLLCLFYQSLPIKCETPCLNYVKLWINHDILSIKIPITGLIPVLKRLMLLLLLLLLLLISHSLCPEIMMWCMSCVFAKNRNFFSLKPWIALYILSHLINFIPVSPLETLWRELLNLVIQRIAWYFLHKWQLVILKFYGLWFIQDYVCS